jgi:hypothetical protein
MTSFPWRLQVRLLMAILHKEDGQLTDLYGHGISLDSREAARESRRYFRASFGDMPWSRWVEGCGLKAFFLHSKLRLSWH